MWRRAIGLSVAVVLLGLVGSVSAERYIWTNLAPDTNSFCDPCNWRLDGTGYPGTPGLPGPDDEVFIRPKTNASHPYQQGPLVDCYVDVWVMEGPGGGQPMTIGAGGNYNIGYFWNWDDVGVYGVGDPTTVNVIGNGVLRVGSRGWDIALQTGSIWTLNVSDNPEITVAGNMRSTYGDDMGTQRHRTRFYLNMGGGSLEVDGRLSWGNYEGGGVGGGGGELNVSGGATIKCAILAYEGGGARDWTLNLNGGTITVTGEFSAPRRDPNLAPGDANAFMNLDAGTLECGSFDHGGYKYAMDINEGMFVIHGDVKTDMEADVAAGYITAFNGTSDVVVEVVDGNTIVRADYIPVEASNPTPADHTINVCPGVELSWQAGTYAVDHNVYFGTSLSDVNESAEPVLDHHGSTQWTPGGLVLGTKYYWRVDEVNDADVNSPWVGDIWEFRTNNGSALAPYPIDLGITVDPNVELQWTSGCTAQGHDIYFGTNFDDVDNATTATAGVFREANWPGNTYSPGTLDFLTYYYWRIDEVEDGNRYKGRVWQFRTRGEIVDPHLILWYRFDEAGGGTAFDSSGLEHHGNTYNIGGNWEPNNGQIKGCLDFDADGHVLVPDSTLDSVVDEITVTVWVNGAPGQDEDDNMIVFDAGDDGSGGDYKLAGIVPTDAPGLDVEWRAGNDTNDLLLWNDATPEAWRGDWHHVAFVKNENEGKMYFYFDGFLRKSGDCETGTLANIKDGDGTFKIGARNSANSDYDGKLDDFRVYDRALSSDEILEFIRGDLRLAWAPQPYDGQPDVPPDANLVWRPGKYAVSHDIYIGTSWDDVNDAGTLDSEFIENREPNMYDPPAPFEMGQTYYWRIDEVNGPNTWKGSVWRFKVVEFIPIDNFEEYDTSGNRVYNTWCDQRCQWFEETGSWLTLSKAPSYPVHGGDQSVEYWYNCNDPYAVYYYAEAWLPLSSVGFTDWTSVDVRLLTLFFYGDPLNAATSAEQMYAGVKDSDGLYGEMRYGDHSGEALTDVQVAEWQRWDVPLVWFTDSNSAAPNDVNFAGMESVHIGFGNRRNPVAGGEGWVYFDDIRLSMPICKPEYGPTGDLNGDCFVGVGDIGAMGDEWLRGDVNLNPVTPPSDANLVAHWELDGDATDSTANGYDGAAEGAYDWVTGKVGSGAIDLSGGWIVVDDNGLTPKLRPKHYVSVMAWVNIDSSADYKVVIKGEDNQETFGLETNSDNGAVFIFRDANGEGPYSVDCGYQLASNEWIHIAGTYNQNEQVIYVNGVAESTEIPGAVELFTDPNDGLGIGGRYGDGADFDGTIDDVRVYDRAVTAGEIGYLAAGPGGMVYLQSEANFYSGESPEIINFKDFAKLFDYWGDEQLWPASPAP